MMTNTIPRKTKDISGDPASDSMIFAELWRLLTAPDRIQVVQLLDSLLEQHT